ncbi:GAF domain-containing sensor histidine kinase [Sinomonas humi]|uniref:Histidine kinase n=1 Tax=Sinomonas humi TaxID=1338436 RepID=A0A0B2AI14_9MICC|nr:GAF domain-containing sensor histidine kinase [Sinomonas humi]KHL01451.1 histidine kinase [Sinomonas humi]
MPDRLPRRLQGLLREFVSRAEELMRLQEHMNGLLSAVVSIAEDLALQPVLERVVESARVLVGARYGALGVIAEGHTLSHFVTAGTDEETAQLLRELTSGQGALGELLRDPRPVRLHDLRDLSVSAAFPADDPPLHTLLEVPIKVRDSVFGNLYLTEKENGEEFSIEDEELAAAFAAAAGVAIQNARLYDDSRRRQRWLEASMVASTTLIAPGGAVSGADMTADLDASADLDLVAERALHASDSVLAVIARPGDERLEVRTAVGALALVAGEDIPFSPALQKVDELGKPVIISDAEEIFGPVCAEKLGEILAVPLGHSGIGNRLLILARGEGTGPYPPSDLDSSAVFGSHVGLALDLNRANRQREHALLSVDRDRIAQDLHDLVIQRLFAAGLSVQNLRRFTTDPTAEARITKVTEELDETIRELRNTIYSLRAEEDEDESFSRTLLNTVREGLLNSPIRPRISVAGRIDEVPASIARQLLAVVSEAVSNAVRHSGARGVSVSVAREDGLLEVVIEDDGRGFSDPKRLSGLANMEQRAASLGGTSVFESTPGEGTKITWRVPLPE